MEQREKGRIENRKRGLKKKINIFLFHFFPFFAVSGFHLRRLIVEEFGFSPQL